MQMGERCWSILSNSPAFCFEINSIIYRHMLETKHRILAIVVLILGFLAIHNGMKGQKIVHKGNAFIEQSDSSSRGDATKTVYTYTDQKGQTDTVYLSKNGSAFIWKTSKKTGKKYRKYLPKVTEALGTKDNKK